MKTTPEFLFENEKGYKDLFDNAHDLIHFAHPDGGLIYVNKSWIRTLEYSQEEIQGKSIYSLVEEPDKELFRLYRNSVIDGTVEDNEKIVLTFKTKHGRLKKLEGFILAHFEDQQIAYTTGIFRDVTEKFENAEWLRKKNEQLAQNEYDLQQLLFYAPDAIIVVDQYGIIQLWNPKASAIFGWLSSEVLGETLTETIIPPQYREAHDKGMRRYMSTGEAVVLNKTIEITALNKSSEEFYVSLTISATHQKGKPAFIAFIRDITAQKNNELELEKNRKALEVSNRELEQFAHVASHDMKEPIRKIKTFMDRTLTEYQDKLPGAVRGYLKKIETAANRLGNLVDGVLAYSTASNTKEGFEELNLADVLKTIEEDLEMVIAEKKAVIKYSSLPSFEGIPFLVYQLFYNLINNSLKFSRENLPARIEIGGKLVNENEVAQLPQPDKKTRYVQIFVKDNGIGFSPKHAEEIFQTFTRLHSKDIYEGTGLGLALCKNIVERHHGFIIADSQENEGSVFKVFLPEKQPK